MATGIIVEEQIDEAETTAHYLVRVEDDVEGAIMVPVDIPLADFDNKTIEERKAIVAAAVQAERERQTAPRPELTEVSGELEL